MRYERSWVTCELAVWISCFCRVSQAWYWAGVTTLNLRGHRGVLAPAQLGALAVEQAPACGALNHV